MPVNSTLASFSDFSFKVTFALYVIGLFVMLAYYVRETLLEEALKSVSGHAETLVSSDESEGVSKAGVSGASSSVRKSNAAADTDSSAGSTLTLSRDSDPEESGRVGALSDSAADAGANSGSSRVGRLFNKIAGPEDGPTMEELEAQHDRVERLGTVGQAVIFLGLMFHIACVVLRGLSAHRFPWGNLYEYVAVASAAAMIVATAVLSRRDNRIMWPWVLTPVIALLFYGGMKLYAASAPVVPALQSYWFPIHVSVVSVGAGFGLISGMFSLAYLLRMMQPRGKEHGFWGRVAAPLPSAKRLDQIAYRTCVIAFPIFGLGVIFGAIWAESAWGRFWGWDPKETMSFVTWIAYAAYLHARATSGWRNRAAAWINIFAFACMVFNLFFINLVVSGLHSYAGLN